MAYISDADLIARFHALRKAKGLSAQQLSDLSGVGRSRISDLEVCRRTELKLQEAIALSAALGIDFRTALNPEPMQVTTAVHVV